MIDAWTGEQLDNVQLKWQATDGILSGQVYTQQYPNITSYEPAWQTGSDGSFPTNVFLPSDITWDLILERSTHAQLVELNELASPIPGDTNALGEKYLTPLDENNNLVADAWEAEFGGLTNAFEDADMDGINNRDEYYAGPTQRMMRMY